MIRAGNRMIFVHLTLWAVQCAVAVGWLMSLGWSTSSFLWWVSALAAAMCAAMLLWLIPQAYRTLLWRRRKSIRPSREVQIERKRIAAALHDGLGSQLVHAMALASSHKDSDMQQLLEQSLLDLRLIVDSMDAEDGPLSLRLARYRHRLQSVLEHRGITLHWDVWDPELLGEEGQLPRGMMAQHIMAILQEAVSNILQHAGAREIWITLAQDTRHEAVSSQVHACLCIEDDGRGLPVDMALVKPESSLPEPGRPAHFASGMGLANMFRRAREIGARLEVQPREGGGSLVRLCW